jgi:hypothetical protein
VSSFDCLYFQNSSVNGEVKTGRNGQGQLLAECTFQELLPSTKACLRKEVATDRIRKRNGTQRQTLETSGYEQNNESEMVGKMCF